MFLVVSQRVHNRLYAFLPVCPEPHCRQRVGKIPQHGLGGAMKEWCIGPMDARHPKKRKESRLFVESRAKVEA